MAQRKVLIVEEESSIRNLMYTLLSRVGCNADVAHSSRQALAMISRQPFDAVLLDLRCSDVAPERVVSGILEIRPSLVGRVLVITGDVADQNTVIERGCLLTVPRHHLLFELWNKLRTLWDFSAASYNSSAERTPR
jgi:DNA-binding NtrC family response regulator